MSRPKEASPPVYRWRRHSRRVRGSLPCGTGTASRSSDRIVFRPDRRRLDARDHRHCRGAGALILGGTRSLQKTGDPRSSAGTGVLSATSSAESCAACDCYRNKFGSEALQDALREVLGTLRTGHARAIAADGRRIRGASRNGEGRDETAVIADHESGALFAPLNFRPRLVSRSENTNQT